MCKHIHHVHSLHFVAHTLQLESPESEGSHYAQVEETDSCEHPSSDIIIMSEFHPTHDCTGNTIIDINSVVWFSQLDDTVRLRTITAFLLELKEQVDKTATLIAPCHQYINYHLHNAVLACRAAHDKSSTTSSSLTNKQYISSHKSEHQWRFPKTNKTPGCKRKGTTLKYVSIT